MTQHGGASRTVHQKQSELKEWCFDLRELIANFSKRFSEIAKARGVSLALKVSHDLPRYFLGDPLRVTDLLNNMALFSLKHLKVGGIFLHISSSSQNRGKELVEIELTDTGSGIPPGRLKSIFLPVSKRKVAGSPFCEVSLYIAKKISLQMGGDVAVQNSYWCGTRYVARLILESLPPKVCH